MATLRSKLFVPTALLAAVMGLTLGALAWQAARQARALEREVTQIRAANALAFTLTNAADEEQRLVLSYHFRPEATTRARIASEELHIEGLLDEIASLGLRPRAADLWSDYTATRALLLAARDELLAVPRGHEGPALSRAFDRWTLTTDRANALLASFASYHVRRLERVIGELELGRSRALATAAAAIGLGVMLAVTFSILLARSLVRPIIAMAAAAERIADQGPAPPVEGAGRGDELGTLARSFNRMTDQLLTANTRLAEAVRSRDEFISIASHELKTPLTPLKLQLQHLLRLARREGEGLTPDRLLQAVRHFDRLVSRLAQLIENMLDVSRLTSGRLTLHEEEVAVAPLLEEVAHRLEPQLRDVGCTLSVESGYQGTLHGDRLRLDQVLENLLANAARYAPRSPVVLRSRVLDGVLLLEVEDGGPGIGPEDQRRIFERFERAAAGHRHGGGLGLGLYIAREIVHAHRGELSLSSEPGGGATFRVQLPLAGPAETADEPAAAAAAQRDGPG